MCLHRRDGNSDDALWSSGCVAHIFPAEPPLRTHVVVLMCVRLSLLIFVENSYISVHWTRSPLLPSLFLYNVV